MPGAATDPDDRAGRTEPVPEAGAHTAADAAAHPAAPGSVEPLCDAARVLAADDPDDDRDPEERFEERVLLLRRALAGGEPSAPALLASAHLERGERREAVDVLAPVVFSHERTDLAGLLGETLAALRDHEAAEAAFQVGVAADDPGALNDYGVFLRGRGRTQEAVYVLERAARAGDDLAPLNLVALHLEELADPEAAAELAERFHDETRPSTLIALADVRLAFGRAGDADALYRRATELGGACAHIYYGWFLQDRREDLVAAEEHLRRAWDVGEPGAAYHLGRFLFDTDRADEAQAWFEEAAYTGDQDALEVLEAEYRGMVDQYDD
jgi:Tfp pilus assembly protein PilF